MIYHMKAVDSLLPKQANKYVSQFSTIKFSQVSGFEENTTLGLERPILKTMKVIRKIWPDNNCLITLKMNKQPKVKITGGRGDLGEDEASHVMLTPSDWRQCSYTM